MESLVREWDGETVIVHYDKPTGAWILIAIHDLFEGTITRLEEEMGLRFIPGKEIYQTECDVLALCALGGVLNAGTIADRISQR
jgi:glutamate dehydrogenase/leucine dehydrogenase